MRLTLRRYPLSLLLIALDALVLYGAFWASFWLRFHAGVLGRTPSVAEPWVVSIYSRTILLQVAVWLVLCLEQGHYRGPWRAAFDEFFGALKAGTFATLVTLALILFLVRGFEYSRAAILLGWALGCAALFLLREGLKGLEGVLRRRWRERTRVVVIGVGRLADSVVEILERHGEEPIRHDRLPAPAAEAELLSDPALHEVVVTSLPPSHADLEALAAACEERHVTLTLIPDPLELKLGALVVDDRFGLPAHQLKPYGLPRTAFVAKRVLDFLLTLAALAACAVPMLVIAWLIRRDSGRPVLYRQPRVGYRGRVFQFLKFRTMTVGAEHQLAALREKSERAGPVFKMKDDPRVTPIGRWLRRFSLDEIPQLLNVLKGDMALVGPRPQVLWEAEQYDSWSRRRLRVLPGLTGLWQVSGRTDLSYEEMIRLDLYYIENWSLELDVKILLRTIPEVLRGSGL